MERLRLVDEKKLNTQKATAYEKINIYSPYIQEAVLYSCTSMVVVSLLITTSMEVFIYEEYLNKLKDECLIRNRKEIYCQRKEAIVEADNKMK